MNLIVHQNRPKTPIDTFLGNVITIEDREDIKRSLPSHVPYERFERNLTNALMANPTLLKCDPRQVLREVMKLAALGLLLDPQLGEAYLIVGYSDRSPVPQARIGYRGLIKLTRQSGEIADVYAREVCPGDEFDCIEGTDRYLKHVPDYFAEDRGNAIGYYAVVRYRQGGADFDVMGIKGINRIRDRSDAYKYAVSKNSTRTPWISDYDEMAKKTVLRRLLKRNPQSPDLASAFAIEDADLIEHAPKRPADIAGKLDEGRRRAAITVQTPVEAPQEPQDSQVPKEAETAAETKTPAQAPEASRPSDIVKGFERSCTAAGTWDRFAELEQRIRNGDLSDLPAAMRKRADTALKAAEDRLNAADTVETEKSDQQADASEDDYGRSEPLVEDLRDAEAIERTEKAREPSIPAGEWTDRDRKWLSNVARDLAKATDKESLVFAIDSHREAAGFKIAGVQGAFEQMIEDARDRLRVVR